MSGGGAGITVVASEQPFSSEASPQSSNPSHLHKKGMQRLFAHLNSDAVQLLLENGRIGSTGELVTGTVGQSTSSDPSLQSGSPSQCQELWIHKKAINNYRNSWTKPTFSTATYAVREGTAYLTLMTPM